MSTFNFLSKRPQFTNTLFHTNLTNTEYYEQQSTSEDTETTIVTIQITIWVTQHDSENLKDKNKPFLFNNYVYNCVY